MRCSIPGPPLGIFVKSSRPSSFCSLKQNGQGSVEMIALEGRPELFLMPLFAKRRGEDIFRALKTGNIKVFDREIQILRARFGIDGKAAIARLPNFFESLIAAQMNDVDRSSRHLCQGDRTRHG